LFENWPGKYNSCNYAIYLACLIIENSELKEMKKQISNLFLAVALVAFGLSSCDKNTESKPKDDNKDTTKPVVTDTFMAATTPKTRTAILEDFTGVRCQYCPNGHVIAEEIKANYPDRFIIIATHGGIYATPAAGWANFTTPYADALINQSRVAGFPAGTISRLNPDDIGASPQVDGGLAMNRNDWSTAAEMTMGMPSPVNLGAKATFDSVSRLLTIKVDIYYTQEETVANNLNIGIVQDNLVSRQSTTSGIKSKYIQNNVLRDYLTGQWGEVITESKAAGSKITKTYTYTVPQDYNGTGTTGGGAVVIKDLKVVAYISRGHKDILSGTEVHVK
jgi:hypothetical protein